MDRAVKFTVTSWYLDRGLPPGETGRSKSNSSSPMNDTPTAANKVKQIFNTFITEGNTFYTYYIYIYSIQYLIWLSQNSGIYPRLFQEVCGFMYVCEVGTVGKISDCQPEGPTFNPQPSRVLDFG